MTEVTEIVKKTSRDTSADVTTLYGNEKYSIELQKVNAAFDRFMMKFHFSVRKL